MPELPEVETIRRDLADLIVGKKILDIETDSPKQVKPSLSEVKKAVVGTKVKQIKRRAKLLSIYLDNSKILAVHLKLTGRLLVRKTSDPRDNWQHVTLTLSGCSELRFADLRKFGWVKLVTEEEIKKLTDDFGPEPMDDLTLERFKEILSKSARPIKIVLMDQTKISGIGNIYAVDALNLAKIDPRKPAKKLGNEEMKNLLDAIEKVLKAGIKYRGASDQYYLDALGQKGSYQDHFLVYNRKGKKCFNCGGEIKKIFLGGRGTYFCPTCQKI
ncbi:bifunctional DNA-formamidopyrimidine glycosylase/DNA-(apurinic or apyrimidinic site) lyase [Patescibacteria group bacterium]|nr:bifunctional DNA-formamidopyrimidine glycosylase/DNA-(apurinic or apyrimidinic site) lyase [Patescibacteria group bacterium]